jgi:hypothetical protein
VPCLRNLVDVIGTSFLCSKVSAVGTKRRWLRGLLSLVLAFWSEHTLEEGERVSPTFKNLHNQSTKSNIRHKSYMYGGGAIIMGKSMCESSCFFDFILAVEVLPREFRYSWPVSPINNVVEWRCCPRCLQSVRVDGTILMPSCMDMRFQFGKNPPTKKKFLAALFHAHRLCGA